MIPGIRISERPYWRYDAAVAARNGLYELTFDDPRTPCVRIEAVGYHPAESRRFQSDEGNQVFDFTLRKAETVAGKKTTATGVVRLPDGAALAGAEVVLVTPAAAPTFNNGRFTQRYRSPVFTTAADGGFALPVPEGDYAIVVLHDRGFAERSGAQLAAEPVVTVQPWGRVEGSSDSAHGRGPGCRLATTGSDRPGDREPRRRRIICTSRKPTTTGGLSSTAFRRGATFSRPS